MRQPTSRSVSGRNHDASKEGEAKPPSTRTLRGLDWLNFFLADLQTGIGPFLAIYFFMPETRDKQFLNPTP